MGANMRARVKWAENRTFIGTSGTGHSFVLGAAHEDGATPGPSPMELMLIGAAGCAAYDVVSILEKGRQAVEDVQVEVSAERADDHPKVFEKLHMHFIVKGRGIVEDRVQKALSLSVEKYCSASAMLAKTAELTYDYALVDTA